MPVHNDDIAELFEEMADLLEIESANPFRVRAYRNAARTIRGLGDEVQDMLAQGQDLTQLPGIGKDLAAKIAEIVTTGHVKALDKLHDEVPAAVAELLKIPGLGPKRVKALYQDLHIKSVKQLTSAAQQGQLQRLPGFGVKTEQRILEAIKTRRGAQKRFLHHNARSYAQALVAYLQSAAQVSEVVVAGSYRRGKETVGDLDILVTASTGSNVMEKFCDYDEVAQVAAKGSTRATVFLRCGLQVDLRVVNPESFGAALHYFTGSKAHNIQIRRLAQKRGLKINEYGVFKSGELCDGKTEASVFKALDLPFIPPELREGRGEIEAAQENALPRLITLEDLRGDLHVHTEATDGSASIKDMALAAHARGLSYIAIADHSQHLTVAHGLDNKRLQQQLESIDRLNETLSGITVLKSAEVDILEQGNLDFPDELLSQLDLVIGAVHSKFRLTRAKQTSRILRAMDHKYFTLLAHPSGRLLGERVGYDVDIPRVIEAAAQRGCFIELNSQPQRLDLTDIQCQMAKEKGVLLCINSDSHAPNQLDFLQDGINQARRGWLEKKNVLNTLPLKLLKSKLKTTMG